VTYCMSVYEVIWLVHLFVTMSVATVLPILIFFFKNKHLQVCIYSHKLQASIWGGARICFKATGFWPGEYKTLMWRREWTSHLVGWANNINDCRGTRFISTNWCKI